MAWWNRRREEQEQVPARTDEEWDALAKEWAAQIRAALDETDSAGFDSTSPQASGWWGWDDDLAVPPGTTWDEL